MHSHAMDRKASRFHGAMAVLAPPRRFELLLLLLARADRSVSQLAAAVALSQSCTTRHLQALERAGLVKGVRDGKRVVFRAAPRDATAAALLAAMASKRMGEGPVAIPKVSSRSARDAARPRARSSRGTGRTRAAVAPPERASAPAATAHATTHAEPYSDAPMASD